MGTQVGMNRAPLSFSRKSPPDEAITLTLDVQEAQAIINALRESKALAGELVFDHVLRLNNKVVSAMREAGWSD